MMSLQEINLNAVALSRLPLSSTGKRKRGEFSPGRSKGTRDLPDALRSAVIILRVFNDDDFEKIKKKTDVKINIVFQIVRKTKAKV